MKEKIYTIPVNEAYDQDCECPLCVLQNQLESEGIDYALGAAMMEPDYRQESNAAGYCRRHFEMLHQKPNKLQLALVLESHLDEIRRKLSDFDQDAEAVKNTKTGLFKKSGAMELGAKLEQSAAQIVSDCIICRKIDHTMERYIDVLLYLWANDEAFHEKFRRSKGFCMPHFQAACRGAQKYLKEAQAARFLHEILKKQEEALSRLQDEIHHFTLKFDYRNQEMEWGTAKDSPERLCQKIGGAWNHSEN